MLPGDLGAYLWVRPEVSLSNGATTTRSPEEIRHLEFGRRVRGYDPVEVEQVLADVADSFESVWHARTRLYEEVQQLREQARRDAATIAELRTEVERNESDRDSFRAEIARLQPESSLSNHAQARADRPSPPESAEGEPGFSPDDPRLGDVTQRFWRERERLLADIRRGGDAVGTEEERKKLLDFLLDALKQVERVSPNGSEAIAEPREQDQNHGSVFAPESDNFDPSSQ